MRRAHMGMFAAGLIGMGMLVPAKPEPTTDEMKAERNPPPEPAPPYVHNLGRCGPREMARRVRQMERQAAKRQRTLEDRKDWHGDLDARPEWAALQPPPEMVPAGTDADHKD